MSLISDTFLDELEAARAAWLSSYVGAFASLPDNPKGARVERFGPVVALATAGIPLAGLFNSVFGLRAESVHLLPDVLAFYREAGTSPRLSIPA